MLNLAHSLPHLGKLVRKFLVLLVLTVPFFATTSDLATNKVVATICCSSCYEACDAQYWGCADNCASQVYGIPNTFSLCLNSCAKAHMSCQNRCLETCDTGC